MSEPVRTVRRFSDLMVTRDADRLRPLLADGDVVLTERLDMIRTPAGEVVGVPVMGPLVVRDGRIARWTDYWDLGLPRKMTGEDVSALVPAY
jgi:limonene-1,2-epoxide hydrolase